MKQVSIKAIALTIIFCVVALLVPLGQTQEQPQERTLSFQLLNHPDGDKTYQLNVTVSKELSDYYTTKSHALFTSADFPKYVTPYALKPIADQLWQIYNDTEDYVNGVLSLVHQITYRETNEGKYPAETMFDGYGDCDLFVYIAASILEAGGIKTAIIYYKNQKHMELGVALDNTPKSARVETYKVHNQDTDYYIGECTGGQWRDGWRIGETPADYQNITAQAIPLYNIEETSIGQVSVTLRENDLSTLILQTPGGLAIEGNTVELKGQILPKLANGNVTLQANINNEGWVTIGSTLTQADGQFEFIWTPQTLGSFSLRAVWLGNMQYNGAMSGPQNLIIVSVVVLGVTASAVFAAGSVSVALITIRRSKTRLPQLNMP